MASSSADAPKIKGIADQAVAAAGALRVGIVHTQWNKVIVDSLVKGAVEELAMQCVVAAPLWRQ